MWFFSDFIARLGAYDIGSPSADKSAEDHVIEKFIKHDEYEKETKRNDIALARLADTVVFMEFIKPACLPNKDVTKNSSTVASGWGATAFVESQDEKLSNVLKKVKLDIFVDKFCDNDFKNLSKKTQICAGFLKGNADTCNGGA